MLLSRHGLAHCLRHGYVLSPAIGRPNFASSRPNSTDSNATGLQSLSDLFTPDIATRLSFKIRGLMRAHPLSLVAVVAPSDLPTPSDPHGQDRPDPNSKKQSALLVSSFNTVSLNPTPYVSFNIKVPDSQTYRNICAFGTFTLSGLGNSITARNFLKRNWDPKSGEGREDWRDSVGKEGKVKHEKGGNWWLLCKYRSDMSTSVGDHVIVVGEVLDAGSDIDEETRALENGASALMYLNGAYRRTGRIDGPSHAARKLRPLVFRKMYSPESVAVQPRKVKAPIVRKVAPLVRPIYGWRAYDKKR